MKTLSDVENLAAGAGIGVFGRFAGRFIAVLAGIIAARFLGPSLFGLYAIGLALLRIAEVVTPLGFDVGVVKYTAGNQDQPAVRRLIIFSLLAPGLFGVLLGLLLFQVSPFIALMVFNKPALETVFQITAFIIPLVGILTVASSITTISKDVRYAFATQDFGQPAISLGLLILALLAGYGLLGVLLADALSYLIATGLVVFFVFRIFPFILYRESGIRLPPTEFFTFSFASFFTVFLSTLMFWFDRLVLGYFLPAGEVGIYQATSQLAVVFAVILGGLGRIFIPTFAALKHREALEEMRNVYRIGTRWAIYLGTPALIFFLIHARGIFLVLYGSEFLSGINILFILLAGQAINLATGPVAPLLVIGGYQKWTVLFSGLALSWNVMLNVILVPRFGGIGAAVASSSTVGALYLALFVMAWMKMGIRPFDRRYFKPLFAAASAGVIGIITSWIFPSETSTLGGLVAQGICILLVFYGLLYILKFEPEDNALFFAARLLFRKLQ